MSTCWHNNFGVHHPEPVVRKGRPEYRCINCGRRCSPYKQNREALFVWSVILFIVITYLYFLVRVLGSWF